ncbi:hypothetical protein AMATHDRAFT_47980 [Amanita thiersii Skay4041]|uniref:F-box domain-containing protein n=1 Tax=Amanita thiersii Skay4041 TaxID=703135 RepID=A0A2A9NQ06_9AGAR|nr:hypothetical protein AMATHDRAFT_47980 [Amanita thiersii Skay4041]
MTTLTWRMAHESDKISYLSQFLLVIYGYPVCIVNITKKTLIGSSSVRAMIFKLPGTNEYQAMEESLSKISFLVIPEDIKLLIRQELVRETDVTDMELKTLRLVCKDFNDLFLPVAYSHISFFQRRDLQDNDQLKMLSQETYTSETVKAVTIRHMEPWDERDEPDGPAARIPSSIAKISSPRCSQCLVVDFSDNPSSLQYNLADLMARLPQLTELTLILENDQYTSLKIS